MFYDVLEANRKSLCPKLSFLKADYYLAGGTGLALQIGHRRSQDFDFFTPHQLVTNDLFELLRKHLTSHTLVKIQEESNTLTVIIDDSIKLSFFSYQYPLLEPLLIEEYFKIASIIDIACMKLSAIVSRATTKDYVDLYFILQKYSLVRLISECKKKFPNLDTNLVLKSLVYFEDLTEEPIEYMPNKNVPFEDIKTLLTSEVKNIL